MSVISIRQIETEAFQTTRSDVSVSRIREIVVERTVENAFISDGEIKVFAPEILGDIDFRFNETTQEMELYRISTGETVILGPAGLT